LGALRKQVWAVTDDSKGIQKLLPGRVAELLESERRFREPCRGKATSSRRLELWRPGSGGNC
jgi:hypothetical protein